MVTRCECRPGTVLLDALGCRFTPSAVKAGLATGAVAAAAVAAVSLAQAALSAGADPAAGAAAADVSSGGGGGGVTEALRTALAGLSGGGPGGSPGAAEGAGGGGATAAAPQFLALVASLVLSECLLAPLAEELVFRGVLLPALLPPPPPPPPAHSLHLDSPAADLAAAPPRMLSQGEAATAVGAEAPAEVAGSPHPQDFGSREPTGLASRPDPGFQGHAAEPATASASPGPQGPNTDSSLGPAGPSMGPTAGPQARAGLGPVAVQAGAFAAYHLSAAELPAQLALGLVLGGGWVLGGRNLAVSITAHAAYNAAALGLLLLTAFTGASTAAR
ncbi:hypothetical protein HYH03_004416 [Edaphochlamys debaryana]|uniref:Uncharacterized protein n=1 Tax=Edaphochlamys debaryana TaxID=47281 RepID=A0A836C3H1_9CHLO|nr:hypothetical protein HYH03_004416 [Edaphochlamys debaryana]|eukprot:KAG2497679.1 hypothetical protein HYH03_004416 [Edaphochlamys debaryana]